MEDIIYTTSSNFKEPALPGDVGYNLPASKDILVQPNDSAEIPTGIKVELPQNTWGLILARSSTNRLGFLLISPGVVDEGFRGEITIMVRNMSTEPFLIESGKSVAQLVLFQSIRPKVIQVDELSMSERGVNAFGSTGQK